MLSKKLIIGFVLLLFLVSCKAPVPKHDEVLQMNLAEHKNLAMHIHPTVSIEINGEIRQIPANLGISNEGMRVIHTHDASGILHIEAPILETFYLEDLFFIWGKKLTESCIFEYCEDDTHKLEVYVNGELSEDKEKLEFKDKDSIKIVYSEI